MVVTTGKRLEDQVQQALAAPFELVEVRWKPQMVSGSRAMVTAYVDARVVMERLDDVVGMANWQDSYRVLACGAVACRLRIRLGSEWISKQDVGGQSEQPDEGDRTKAAYSDALKRTAVKFGVGRYLYRLPRQWVDYDPQKKQIVRTPELPEWARPGTRKAGPKLPSSGQELKTRLTAKDADLASKKLIQPGELLQHIETAGKALSMPADIVVWAGQDIKFAVEAVRAFESRLGGVA